MNAVTPFARTHSACFVQTQSGVCVDVLAPDLSRVSLTDLATSLSRLPRFLGNTKAGTPYSVAQHSLLVLRILEDQGQPSTILRAGLLHDAHEALMGDIPTPIKAALGEPMRALEGRLQAAVFRRFGLSMTLAHHPLLSWADRVALHSERRDLLAESEWPWPGEDRAPVLWHERIEPVRHSEAFGQWLNAALRLRLDGVGRLA